jgi:hypothetical protein
MGTTSKAIEDKRRKCNSSMVEYHTKNPWIDDFESECPACEPGEAVSRLRSRERRAARENNELEKELSNRVRICGELTRLNTEFAAERDELRMNLSHQA